MTTATLPPNAYAPRERIPSAVGRLSFIGVLRGEWIKLLSLRSIRWSIAVMLLVSWGGAALMSSAMSSSPYLGQDAAPMLIAQSATFGTNITVLVMAVLGVLAMTSEYASGLILSSLSAVPSRLPLLAAKAVVVALLGFLIGAASTFGGGLLAALIAGDGAFSAYFEGAVLASMLGAALFLMLAALLALGVGALLRSSAGAISVAVLLLFVATLVFQILGLTGWEWVPEVAKWMPSELGRQLSTASLSGGMMSTSGVGYWPALAGLVGWAAAALIPAAILLKTRDAV